MYCTEVFLIIIGYRWCTTSFKCVMGIKVHEEGGKAERRGFGLCVRDNRQMFSFSESPRARGPRESRPACSIALYGHSLRVPFITPALFLRALTTTPPIVFQSGSIKTLSMSFCEKLQPVCLFLFWRILLWQHRGWWRDCHCYEMKLLFKQRRGENGA